MVARVVCLVALFSFLFIGMVRADDPMLPGSTLKVEDAAIKSDVFFVGEIVSLSPVNPEASALTGQFKSKVGSVKLIRGALYVPTSGVPVWFTVADGEAPPQAGSTYVFCVLGKALMGVHVYTAIKLLPATPENIAMVMKLADHRPAGPI